jgi:hypothetical protein
MSQSTVVEDKINMGAWRHSAATLSGQRTEALTRRLNHLCYSILYWGRFSDWHSRRSQAPRYASLWRLIEYAVTSRSLSSGQSNSANHGEAKFKTRFPKNVLNYFDGAWYVAESLLGSDWRGGEFITPLVNSIP